jgi:hypothetical protein
LAQNKLSYKNMEARTNSEDCAASYDLYPHTKNANNNVHKTIF